MFGRSNSWLSAACVGLVVGLSFGWTAPSSGQEQFEVQTSQVPPASAVPADVVALKAQIVALAKRIEELEKPDLSDYKDDPVPALIKRIEALEKAVKEPIKAPFAVANAAGAPIFTVTADGGDARVNIAGTNGAILLKTDQGPTLELGSGDDSAVLAAGKVGPSLALRSGESSLFAGAAGEEMTVLVRQGPNTAALFASDDGATISVVETGRSAKLGTADSTFGYSAEVNDERVAALGDRGDGTYSLRLYKPGATLPVVQAGVLSSGDAGVIVGDGINQFARMEGKDGAGAVRTYKGGKEVVTLGRIDQSIGLVVVDGNEAVRSVVGGPDGPEFSAFLADQVFFFVDAKDGKPRLELGKAGQNLWMMETGNDGALTLYDPSGEVAKMGARGGSGTLALSKAGSPTITLGPTADKPNPAIRTYAAGQVAFAAGTTMEGYGAVTVFWNGTGVAGIESSDAGNGEVYVTNQGKTVASMNSVDQPGEGVVVIRNGHGAAVAFLGNGSSGGGNVTVADPAGNGVFSAGYIGSDGPGAACVERNGTKCLGVGLTGMEGFR